MGARLWAFEDFFVLGPMGEPSRRWHNNGPVRDDNSGLEKDWI